LSLLSVYVQQGNEGEQVQVNIVTARNAFNTVSYSTKPVPDLQCVPQAALSSLPYVYIPATGAPLGDAACVNIVTACVAFDTESYFAKTVTKLQCDPRAALSSSLLIGASPRGTHLSRAVAPVAYAAAWDVCPDPIGHPGVYISQA
jgi:hypothetical protein